MACNVDIGLGLFHSGVEINGRVFRCPASIGAEYSFGEETGITKGIPKEVMGASFRESIFMGKTFLTDDEIDRRIDTLRKSYRGDQYHMVLKWAVSWNFHPQELQQLLERSVHAAPRHSDSFLHQSMRVHWILVFMLVSKSRSGNGREDSFYRCGEPDKAVSCEHVRLRSLSKGNAFTRVWSELFCFLTNMSIHLHSLLRILFGCVVSLVLRRFLFLLQLLHHAVKLIIQNRLPGRQVTLRLQDFPARQEGQVDVECHATLQQLVHVFIHVNDLPPLR